MQVFPRLLGIMPVDFHDRVAVGRRYFLGQDYLNLGQQIAGRAILSVTP